jgi:hypothetical protein
MPSPLLIAPAVFGRRTKKDPRLSRVLVVVLDEPPMRKATFPHRAHRARYRSLGFREKNPWLPSFLAHLCPTTSTRFRPATVKAR